MPIIIIVVLSSNSIPKRRCVVAPIVKSGVFNDALEAGHKNHYSSICMSRCFSAS